MKTQNAIMYSVLVVIVVTALIIGLFTIFYNIKDLKDPNKPVLKGIVYQPCYVQLDERQFERLIEALKGEKK